MQKKVILNTLNSIEIVYNPEIDKTIVITGVVFKLENSILDYVNVKLEYSDGTLSTMSSASSRSGNVFYKADNGSEMAAKNGQNLIVKSDDIDGVLTVLINYELV